MQADYRIMPKRNGKSDDSFKKLPLIKFFTNYYDIAFDNKKSVVYQYSFALPQDIPQDSKLYERAIMSIKRNILKQKIGYLAHTGQIIWGNVCLKVPTTILCKFEFEEKKFQLESIIKLTKELDLKDLNQDETRPKLLQILNSNIKNTLRQIKLCQLGKQGQYFKQEQQKDKDLEYFKLRVLKGFRFTLVTLNSGLFLQVDVCSRVLQAQNLLEIFNGKPRDEILQKYTGITVISNYGTYRTYRIQKIDYDKTPLSTFHNEKKGETMTFRDYYHQAYGISVKNIKQPLLLAIKSIKKQLKKGGKQYEQKKEYVYLVPEFVSPTGMTDGQRADYQCMKALSPYTKLSPGERVKQCQGVIKRYNQAKGLIQIKGAKRLEGYCLGRPQLIYQGAKILPDNRGNIKHRGILKEPENFVDWAFVYSIGKNPKKDDNDADDAISLIQDAAKIYGVKFGKVHYITVDGNGLDAWKNEIRKEYQKNKKPIIYVIYLNSWEQRLYGPLKKFFVNEIQCANQFIRKKTLTQKNNFSAASKIVIQMNIKAGSVPWEVQKRHEYFKGRKLMYGALSISKGKKGYTLAFVGTINNQCSRVYSECKTGIKDKENIPLDVLQRIFLNWGRYYHKTTGAGPETIILYREGLSDKQAQSQLPRTEIPALEKLLKKIGQKTGVKNSQFMIVLVNKKINSRYFAIGRENNQNPNKFTPEIYNPDSGSIMVESMSTPDSYDFHLAAQYVTQGTCTPTLFKVAYDTTKMPQEALINFTFEQCFNYYNWEGAVRVPACLQCADKLSNLVSQYVQEDVIQSELMKTHFFL